MKKNLFMFCGVVAFAIGCGDIVNALQAGTAVPPVGVICVILGVIGVVGNALRSSAKPTSSDL